MRVYFDTSCVAKCYVLEAGSAVVRRVSLTASSIHCSELGRVELVSVLGRAFRDRRLSRRLLHDAFAQCRDDDERQFWNWIPVSGFVLEDASRRLEAVAEHLSLSGADAIHLSTARLAGFDEIWTTDRRMIAAAPTFGLVGRDPTV